jgi:hypothetical protein
VYSDLRNSHPVVMLPFDHLHFLSFGTSDHLQFIQESPTTTQTNWSVLLLYKEFSGPWWFEEKRTASAGKAPSRSLSVVVLDDILGFRLKYAIQVIINSNVRLSSQFDQKYVLVLIFCGTLALEEKELQGQSNLLLICDLCELTQPTIPFLLFLIVHNVTVFTSIHSVLVRTRIS